MCCAGSCVTEFCVKEVCGVEKKYWLTPGWAEADVFALFCFALLCFARKQLDQKKRLDVVMHVCLESLRVCALLLQPIVPVAMDDMLTQLSVSSAHRSMNYARYVLFTRVGY